MGKCETCRHFDEYGDDEEGAYGQCLRFPPVYIGVQHKDESVTHQWRQPFVLSADTCGEHRRRRGIGKRHPGAEG